MKPFAQHVRDHMALVQPITSRIIEVEKQACEVAWNGGNPTALDTEASRLRARREAGEEWEVMF